MENRPLILLQVCEWYNMDTSFERPGNLHLLQMFRSIEFSLWIVCTKGAVHCCSEGKTIGTVAIAIKDYRNAHLRSSMMCYCLMSSFLQDEKTSDSGKRLNNDQSDPKGGTNDYQAWNIRWRGVSFWATPRAKQEKATQQTQDEKSHFIMLPVRQVGRGWAYVTFNMLACVNMHTCVCLWLHIFWL